MNYLLLFVSIAVYVLFFLVKRNSIIKQVNTLNKLLYSEKSPNKYIEEIDKYLKKMQSKKERSINLIQKTTGLFYDGRFDEAINILTEDIKTIPPNWQHIYYHNLILSLFFNNEKDRANKILDEARDVLEVYEKKDYNKTAIEFIYSVADFYNGNGISRKEFFDDLRENGRNDYRKAFAYYFYGKICEQEENFDEGEENIEKSMVYGKGSFLENL